MQPAALRALLAALLVLAAAVERAAAETFEYSRLSMGSRIRLLLVGDSENEAAAAAQAAFARLDELERAWSDFREDSELSRLNAAAGGPAIAVSPDLFAALAAAKRLAEQTDGAFDPTIGPLVRLWRTARSEGRLPDEETLASAKALVGPAGLELDEAAGAARLQRPGMRLDLGGIGKGLAVDALRDLLVERGFESCLVDFGSAVAAAEPPLGRQAWTVEAPSIGPVALRNAAIAFSGDGEQFVEIDGVRYSHIVDPRTGLGLANRAQAAVIAADGATADALATAACVLGPSDGAALGQRFPDARLAISAEADGVVTSSEAVGFAHAGVRTRDQLRPNQLHRNEHQAANGASEHGGRAGAGVADAGAIDTATVIRRRELPDRRLMLEVAAVSMRSPRPGLPPVTLVGVAHIGSRDLYRRVQEILDGHELVLYESVMPVDAEGPGGDTAAERVASTRTAMVTMAEVLERLRRREQALPATLDDLARDSRRIDSRLVRVLPKLSRDAWGRELRYEQMLDSEGAPFDFSLKSFGADGVPGGKGEDADIVVTRPLTPDLEDEGLQADLAETLGLAFQLRAIDYSNPRFRCADLTVPELQKALAAQGVQDVELLDTLAGTSLPARVVKIMLTLVKMADGLLGGAVRDMLTVLMIELLSEADVDSLVSESMGEGFAKVIVGERNQVAVDALRQAAEGDPGLDSVAIFYGAAHLPDLAKRLNEQLGYEAVAIEWIPAIEVDLARSNIDEAQLRQMRGMVRKALEQAKRRR